jgi:type 1 glutamine amidotransferase
VSGKPTQRAVVYTGGINHPFETAAPALAGVLADAGFDPVVHWQIEDVVGNLRRDASALLVIYALRWGMTQHEKYEPHRAQWALKLPEATGRVLAEHVANGAGLLAIHTASICFDTWPEWRRLLGGVWVWGQSHHPVLGPVEASLDRDHLLTRGLDGFALTDEVYTDLAHEPDIEIAAHARVANDGKWQASVWTHHYGRGRVVYDALGHDAASLTHPVHRRVLQRAALWASGQPDHRVEAA